MRQEGSTLITVLVLLVGLTLLAVGMGFSSIMEERLGRGFRDNSVAFNAAENAIRRLQLKELDRISRTELPDCARFTESSFTPDAALTGICQVKQSDPALIERYYGTNPLFDELKNTSPLGRASRLSGSFGDWTTGAGEAVVTPRYFVERTEVSTPLGGLAGSSLSGNLSFTEAASKVGITYQYRITVRGFGPQRGGPEPISRTIEATFQ